MKKKIIRLTESDLHNIVKESTRKILKEFFFSTPSDDIESDDEIFDDWLKNSNNEDEYYNDLEFIKDMKRTKGENAMDYHPQRNRSTLNGDDFASSYAKDPTLGRKDPIEYETDLARMNYGFN